MSGICTRRAGGIYDSTRLRTVYMYDIGNRNAHLYTTVRIFGTTVPCFKPKFGIVLAHEFAYGFIAAKVTLNLLYEKCEIDIGQQYGMDN